MASQQVLWQQGQPVAYAAVASKESEQELQIGTLAMEGRGQHASGQAGIVLDLEMPVRNKYNLGKGFQERHGAKG